MHDRQMSDLVNTPSAALCCTQLHSSVCASLFSLHHRGLSPEESDTQFLRNAAKLTLYGVDAHPARV